MVNSFHCSLAYPLFILHYILSLIQILGTRIVVAVCNENNSRGTLTDHPDNFPKLNNIDRWSLAPELQASRAADSETSTQTKHGLSPPGSYKYLLLVLCHNALGSQGCLSLGYTESKSDLVSETTEPSYFERSIPDFLSSTA